MKWVKESHLHVKINLDMEYPRCMPLARTRNIFWNCPSLELKHRGMGAKPRMRIFNNKQA